MLAGTLPLLTRKQPGVWNFRCTFCGDSKKSKTKARGFLIQDKGRVYSMCHNCGETHQFPKFLELVNPQLYSEYALEAFGDRKDITVTKPVPTKDLPTEELYRLPKISLLPPEHDACQFLAKRLIPRKQWSKLFYAEDFNGFARNFFTDKYQGTYVEPRIIIPLIHHKKLVGFQGRAIGNSDIRYITALLSPSNNKIFGIDNVNFNKQNFVFEGVLDALFIPNSLAVLGSSIDTQLRHSGLACGQTVIVYDNEPRNEQICKQIRKAIRNGYKVVIWPSSVKEKDINDMIIQFCGEGMSVDQAIIYVMHIMRANIYKGMDAEVKFNAWKK